MAATCLRNRRGVVAAVVVAMSRVIAGAPAEAGAPHPRDAVAEGREALSESGSYPWYDPERDNVRSVELRDGWLARWLTPVADWLAGLWNVNWSFARPLAWLAWIAIALLLAGLAYLFIRAFLERESLWGESTGKSSRHHRGSLTPGASLPWDVGTEVHDLLAAARRHYEKGDYSKAIVYFFSHQLVELDRHQVIRLAKGRTNRQYLAETARNRPLESLVRRTMVAFEEVFFGGRRLSREGFESCWTRLGEFDSLLAQGGK